MRSEKRTKNQHPEQGPPQKYIQLSPTQEQRLNNPGHDDASFPAALVRDTSVGASDAGGNDESPGGSQSGSSNAETLELGYESEPEGENLSGDEIVTQEDKNPSSHGGSDEGGASPGSPNQVSEGGFKAIEEGTNPNDSDEFPDSQVSSNWPKPTATKRHTTMTMMNHPFRRPFITLVPAITTMILKVMKIVMKMVQLLE